jgi:hypothetical protein
MPLSLATWRADMNKDLDLDEPKTGPEAVLRLPQDRLVAALESDKCRGAAAAMKFLAKRYASMSGQSVNRTLLVQELNAITAALLTDADYLDILTTTAAASAEIN